MVLEMYKMFEIEIIHFPPPSLDSPPLFGRETPTPMIISPKPHEVIPCRPPSASVIFRVLVLSFLLTSAVCLLYALEKDDTVDHWLDSSGELGPPFSDEEEEEEEEEENEKVEDSCR